MFNIVKIIKFVFRIDTVETAVLLVLAQKISTSSHIMMKSSQMQMYK